MIQDAAKASKKSIFAEAQSLDNVRRYLFASYDSPLTLS